MENSTARKLQDIGHVFNLEGQFFSYEEITMGNVNQTYKVNYVSNDDMGATVLKPYMVQKINSYAFHNPDELMSNIDKVTEYIRTKRPDRVNMHFHHTSVSGKRKNYFSDGNSFWRVYKYIPAVTFDKCDNIELIRNAGKAFGEFQMNLNDFPVLDLYYTIPNFHDTKKRYQRLLKNAEDDPLGRLSEVQEEYNYLMTVRDKACKLTQLYEEGELPLRVTHNDTKINNVLFDETTLKPLAIIDLDTVMPGLVGHDFGDAIRFVANFEEEDSESLSKVGINLNTFEAFADGFLSQTANTLTELEISTLALSCFCITCELATRFLDDFLIGDKYFKVKKDKHNLIRTKNQIALAKDMEKNMESMQVIINTYAGKYAKEMHQH